MTSKRSFDHLRSSIACTKRRRGPKNNRKVWEEKEEEQKAIAEKKVGAELRNAQNLEIRS